jgi:hypothetical protein
MGHDGAETAELILTNLRRRQPLGRIEAPLHAQELSRPGRLSHRP